MNDEYTRLVALERWRKARNRAHELYVTLQQEERCWALLPGDSARSLARSLYAKCCSELDAIRVELEDAERIWSLTERMGKVVEVQDDH